MATAIERNFDTMGYRMYFAKIPKFSQQEKEFMTEKSTPFAVTDHICYFVYQIHQLYQTIDFEKEELLIYGW